MSEFKITEEKIPFIARELGVDLKLVEDFLPVFQDFYKEVCTQHLSSVMRALELCARKKLNIPAFKVDWVSMPSGVTNSTVSVGLRWPLGYFLLLPPGLSDVLQIRNFVAHELGHLFYALINPMNVGDADLNQKMANVFGVFTILERSEFYKEKAPKMTRNSWRDVINDFKQMG
jgi:hypothetical protein